MTFGALCSAIVANTLAAQATKSRAAGNPLLARAQLMDAEGRSVGEAQLLSGPGVLLKLHLTKVAPGIHALHIHTTGRCDAPSFASAGGHFNPTNHHHGIFNSDGPHAGDLPNIEVPSGLQYSAEYFVDDVTLEPGPTSLMDADGSAIVIHAGRDDYRTDPAGDAGERLACGPIVR